VRASGFPFRVPEVLAAWETAEGEPVLVERFVAGVPLDLRAGRQPVEPWDIVGRIAAAIHAVPSAIPGPATRRAHALEELRSLTGLDPALRERADSWAREHLPPDEPSGLVHGDLLGQNIRLGLGEPDGVIDWACARRGDPAYDLSIVTRGARQPFQIGGGLDRLLASWHRAGGTGVLPEHVHVYELALLATQVTDGVHDAGTRLEALLRRLGA
jgi:aminoglycoside phosphotransferase (APT) family kinase protein